MEEKKSFFDSMVSGIKGYVKGALAGGIVGAASGAVIGAVVGIITGGVGPAALVGMVYGASVLASIGALAGTMTEVVRSREAGQVSGEDVANVAKISYAQGMMVGHNVAQEQQAEASTKFRDKVAQQRAQAQQAQKTH